MNVEEYLSSQPAETQQILKKIHQVILKNDKTVEAIVEPMMGKEMIIYKAKGMMKYGLANMKKYMSLHALPIYMNQPLHLKYEPLFPKASFQKGCINFTDAESMPLELVSNLITACSGMDLHKMREETLKARKAKKK